VTSSANISSISDFHGNEKEECEKYKQLVKKQHLRLIIMRKKMETLQYRNKKNKNVISNPLQFTNDLKIIAISMYIKDIFNTNYDKDDGQYLLGFLEYL